MLTGHDLTEAAALMRANREKVIETNNVELDATEIEALRVEVQEALQVLSHEVSAVKSVIQAIGKAADEDLRRK